MVRGNYKTDHVYVHVVSYGMWYCRATDTTRLCSGGCCRSYDSIKEFISNPLNRLLPSPSIASYSLHFMFCSCPHRLSRSAPLLVLSSMEPRQVPTQWNARVLQYCHAYRITQGGNEGAAWQLVFGRQLPRRQRCTSRPSNPRTEGMEVRPSKLTSPHPSSSQLRMYTRPLTTLPLTPPLHRHFTSFTTSRMISRDFSRKLGARR